MRQFFTMIRKEHVAVKHESPWLSYKVKPSRGCAPTQEVKDCSAVVPGAPKRPSAGKDPALQDSLLFL